MSMYGLTNSLYRLRRLFETELMVFNETGTSQNIRYHDNITLPYSSKITRSDTRTGAQVEKSI